MDARILVNEKLFLYKFWPNRFVKIFNHFMNILLLFVSNLEINILYVLYKSNFQWYLTSLKYEYVLFALITCRGYATILL